MCCAVTKQWSAKHPLSEHNPEWRHQKATYNSSVHPFLRPLTYCNTHEQAAQSASKLHCKTTPFACISAKLISPFTSTTCRKGKRGSKRTPCHCHMFFRILYRAPTSCRSQSCCKDLARGPLSASPDSAYAARLIHLPTVATQARPFAGSLVRATQRPGHTGKNAHTQLTWLHSQSCTRNNKTTLHAITRVSHVAPNTPVPLPAATLLHHSTTPK